MYVFLYLAIGLTLAKKHRQLTRIWLLTGHTLITSKLIPRVVEHMVYKNGENNGEAMI